MATAHDSSHAEYHPGDMPIEEQKATFTGVVGMFKWGSLFTAAALILLTMWFCTPAGFFPALVVAVIVLVLGVVFLRTKPEAEH